MGTPVERLEDLIKEVECERDRLTLAIDEMCAALARMKNGAGPQSMHIGARKVFERKYEQNARDVIDRLFPNDGQALHLGQIKDLLHSNGYDYKKATVRVNVNHLVADEVLKVVKAPKGSGYSFAYTKHAKEG